MSKVDERCGEALRRAREMMGKSQREVAIGANLAPSTVMRAERGEPVMVSTLVAMAKALGVKPGAIIEQAAGNA